MHRRRHTGRRRQLQTRRLQHGRHRRDFTWVDDVVDGVLRVLDRPASPDPDFDPGDPTPDRSDAPFRVYNLGNDTNVDLLRFVGLIEQAMDRTSGNQSAAARLLGISRYALRYRLEKHQVTDG